MLKRSIVRLYAMVVFGGLVGCGGAAKQTNTDTTGRGAESQPSKGAESQPSK